MRFVGSKDDILSDKAWDMLMTAEEQALITPLYNNLSTAAYMVVATGARAGGGSKCI